MLGSNATRLSTGTIFLTILSVGFHTFASPPKQTLSDAQWKDKNQYRAVLHVQSDMSSGSYALPKLTEVAKGYGLDAVFLTDNITEYIQFGLPPLRNILWAGYSLPSIMTFGPENYLDAIQRENARQDDILYVAGAETCPRVYWTGALRNQDLVCHNHQRNIIALGPFDAQTLRDIPECCGFIPGKHTYWIIATRALLALFIFAIFCFLFVAPVLARRSGLSTRDIRWSALATVILPIALVCFAADWWARQQPDFQIYGEEHAPTHEQAMIDYFNRHNIVHYWAHPEAVDHHEFDYHGIRFQADTAPYPGVLLTTSGYTAFGGVYEGKNNLTDPGSLWDKALEQYLDGSRPAPAWCYGEMLYHYEGQAKTKKLGNVETVILAETRTPDALLEGLRTGQCYARRNTDANYLVLDDWKLEQTTSENADAEVTATLALSSKQPDTRATIQLIRNGEVIATDERDLPTTFSHTAPLEGKACYRAVVTAGHPLKLATNPLFTENIAAPPPQRVGM